MENPWKEFDKSIDYSNLVLKSEQKIIKDFNESLGPLYSDNYGEYSIHTEVTPAPFMGNVFNSPIVLLTLNPGWDPNEADCGFYSKYSEVWLNMIQSPGIPLFCLDEEYIKDSKYWNCKLRPLFEHKIDNQEIGKEVVSKKISIIQFFPYQSKKFKPIGKRICDEYLPSQKFNFELVQNAMDRKATIIILRRRRLWFEAIPGLEEYENLYFTNSYLNTTLSKGNLEAFDKIVEILINKDKKKTTKH